MSRAEMPYEERKKREPQLDSNSQTQLEVSLLQVVVFKLQTQTTRKFWLSHAPQIVYFHQRLQ